MDWLADPNDHRVRNSLAWTCDLCNAAKQQLCANPLHPGKPLPGRIIHLGRLIDRRREK